MPERQDFIQRLLEELGQFLTEVARYRQAGQYEAALFTLLQAQERLFARPVQEFMTRPVAEQVHLLALGETAVTAREKCLAYARLLDEAGLTYQAREQPALAQGAYQWALHITLLVALQFPPADSAALQERLTALRAKVPAAELGADVRGLLERLAAQARAAAAPTG